MLRVVEQYSASDTGRQRRANEDSMLARAPLFVVADGMGGAQAGEVASRIAVECFQRGLGDAADPEAGLAELARAANARIHELSHANAEQAGMGTTLTAVYVGEREVAIAHVGDSRVYCLRDGRLARLTDDHSLVDELLRQGRLTPEEAVEHPQRSVITRALGPEGTVEVDTRSFQARAGDVFLLCSDGLTTMLSEQEIASLLSASASLHEAGEALIAAANDAGGRDNITVVLARLGEAGQSLAQTPEQDTAAQAALAAPIADGRRRAARVPRPGPAPAPTVSSRRRRPRALVPLAVAAVVVALLAVGAYVALQSVFFVATNERGLVTIYRGVPFELPGNLALYSSDYVSGVSASTLSPQRRRTLLDHSLRSEANAAALIRSLELGEVE